MPKGWTPLQAFMIPVRQDDGGNDSEVPCDLAWIRIYWEDTRAFITSVKPYIQMYHLRYTYIIFSDLHISFFKKIFYLFIFREGEGKEKERERNIDWLLPTHPQLGTSPATKACALTGNWTCNFPVCRLVLNPLSHISQGIHISFKI